LKKDVFKGHQYVVEAANKPTAIECIPGSGFCSLKFINQYFTGRNLKLKAIEGAILGNLSICLLVED